MKRICFVAITMLLLMQAAPAEAQNRRMIFRGKVLDRETRAPIKGANITITGTRKGAVSADDGSFTFTIYYAPVYMNVSYVGYESQRIWIEETTPFITVLLSIAPTPLAEVEIRSKTEPVPFFKDNKYAVLDYEVDSGLVWMIIYRFRRINTELICKTISGDTIARTDPLRFKPSELFRDCLGNIHILTEDSAWQLYIEGDRLRLIYPVPLPRLKASLGPCVAASDSLLFLRKISPDGMIVNFSAIDRKSSKVRQLQMAADPEKLKMLRDSPYDRYLLMLDTIPDDFSTATYMHWLKKIIYPPNTSTLHKIGDLMCVFNTADYTLTLYTLQGDFTARLKMPVEKITDGKWTTEIYIDDVQNKAYTSFRKGGQFTLYRIDLNTGDLKRQFSATHNFPRKFRVHNNWVFYLYDIPGEGDNKHIFRQKL